MFGQWPNTTSAVPLGEGKIWDNGGHFQVVYIPTEVAEKMESI